MSYAAARHELERQLEALKRIQNREAAEKARLTDEIQSTNVQAVLAEARRIRLRGFDLKSPFFCQRANPDLPNESNA